MSSSSLPALPTKGSPVAKTVLVRLFARSHLVHTETWRASSSSRLSRLSPPSAVSKRLSKAPPRAVLVTYLTIVHRRRRLLTRDKHRAARGTRLVDPRH